MRDTLENLYFGNITPNDQTIKSGTALKEAMEQSAECEEKLTALLEGKEKTLLLRLLNAENEVCSTMALENFILGFRLGMQLTVEGLLGSDDGSLIEPNKEGYKKVSHGMSWERKRDIAKSRDHIIKASLVDKHPSGEVSRYNWRAVYRYTVADEERQYVAHFKHPATPPLYLYLYYVDDPDKLFSCEEYHYENHKGLLLFPVIFLPWILACIALVLLGVDLSGF